MTTVVAWNVKHSTPPNQIVAALEELIDGYRADVLCLQEIALVSVVPPVYDVAGTLARATRWNAHFTRHPNVYLGWIEGVAILTRHPIIIMQSSRYRISSRRAYLEVTVADPDLGDVRIGSLHLSLPGLREAELHAVLKHVPPRRSIVAGDFNAELINPILEPLLAKYNADGLQGIDHVCVSHDLRLVRAEIVRTAPSDHDAVIGEVRPL
jgi:endonuclease/exonuclease/phosphatase family metal-dependent hydrolase